VGQLVSTQKVVCMIHRIRYNLLVWAARDLSRQPVQTVLLFTCLASIVMLMALVLVLHQTIAAAARRCLADTPAMVIQRVDSQGWRPLPADEAMARIAAVAGAVRPRVRVRGVAQTPLGPVTVIGATRQVRDHLPGTIPMPGPGQALVGPTVMPATHALSLTPPGRPGMHFTVIHRLTADRFPADQAPVVLNLADARALLGLAADQASDLALEVFHEDEARAMIPDIIAALGWPVRVTTRKELLERTLADLSQRSGRSLMTLVPAVLAMALLTAAMGAWSRQRRWEMALYKAVGWRAADILQLYLYRAALVGGAAVLAGAAGGCLLLFAPGMTRVSQLLFNWNAAPPLLFFTFRQAGIGFLLSALMVGVPYMAVIFWTGWQAASLDPADGLAEGAG
jgi:predicted lysophospholipase L1 biosynthesis ABC-type transport system permease subunit